MEGDTEKVSTEIDQRVVEMKFNNKNFERNVSTSMSTLEKFKKSLDFSGATKGVDELNKAAGKFSLKGMDESVGTVTAKFDALTVAAITAMSRITNAAYDAGVKLVKSLSVDNIAAGWNKLEQKNSYVQTILNATGKSMSEVNSYLNKLMWFSDETSYGFTDMTAAIAQMTASGGDIQKLIPLVMGIANATAYAGKGASEFSRVMYNLNQSYGGGYLSYMDWRSVELAGVASEQLKQIFIDTGIALGKIKKGQVTISNFGTTLKDRWADTEVMETAFGYFAEMTEKAYAMVNSGEVDTATEAYAKLAEEYDTVSMRAAKAAQEAKSFTEAIDATKDAVSSGWMRTFELVFGNYEEAKELFSRLAEELYTVFAEGGNRRNEVLGEGLLSGWEQLNNLGIPDMERYKKAAIAAAKDHGIAIDQMIEETGSFEASLQKGWLTQEILVDSVYRLTNGVRTLSDEELRNTGYTDDQVNALKRLNDRLFDGSLKLYSYTDKLSRVSDGRDNLIQGFWNLWDALFAVDEETDRAIGIVSVFKETIREVFPAITGERIYEFTEKFRDLTSSAFFSEEALDGIRIVLKAILTPIKYVTKLIGSGLKFSGKLVVQALKLADGFFALIKRAGPLPDLLDRIFGENRGTRAAEAFGRAIEHIRDILGTIRQRVRDAFAEFRESEEAAKFIQQLKDFLIPIGSWILDRIIDGLEAIARFDLDSALANMSVHARNFLGFISAIPTHIRSIFALIRANSPKELFNTLASGAEKLSAGLSEKGENNPFGNWLERTKDFAERIPGYLSTAKQAITDFASKITPARVLIFAFGSTLVAFFFGLARISNEIADLIGTANKTVGSFNKLLGSLNKRMKRSNIILQVAVAIGVLAASLYALGQVPADRLKQATISLLEIIGAFTAAAVILQAMTMFKGFDSGSLQKVGIAILAVAGAMKIVSTVDTANIRKQLTSFGMLLVEFAGFMVAMRIFGGKMSIGPATILSVSGAMLVLVLAMKALSKLDAAKALKSLTAMLPVILFLPLLGRAMRGVKFGGAAGMTLMITNLMLMASAMQRLAKYDITKVIRAIPQYLVLVAGLIGLGLAAKAGGSGAMKGGAGILAVSGAVYVLGTAVKQIGALSWGEITKGGAVAAGAIAMFSLLILAFSKLEKDTGRYAIRIGVSIIAMSGAILILTAAIKSLNVLTWEEIAKGGGVVTALLGMFALITKNAGGLKGSTAAIIAMIVAVGLMTVCLAMLSLIPAEELLPAALALGGVMLAMSAAFKLMAGLKLKNVAVGFVGTLASLTVVLGGIAAVGAIFGDGTVIENGVSILELLASPKLAAAFAGIAALAAIMGLVGLIPASALAVGAVALLAFGTIVNVLVAEVGGMQAGIKALGGDMGFWEDAVTVLGYIGEAIGNFLGGLAQGVIGGIGSGIGDSLPPIGEGIAGFINAFGSVDPENVDKLKGAADALLTFSAAALASVAGLVAIPSLLVLAGEIIAFGPIIGTFADETAKHDFSNVDTAVSAAKGLAEFISALPRSDGLLQTIIGEPASLQTFSEGLEPFGQAIIKLQEVLPENGIDEAKIDTAVKAGELLVGLQKSLPRSGGVLQDFIGEFDWTNFIRGIVPFGTAITLFQKVLPPNGIREETVKTAVDSGKLLAELQSSLPRSGGALQRIIGEFDWSQFNVGIVAFAKAITSYSDIVSAHPINLVAVTSTTVAGRLLAALNTAIPESGGWLQVFFGEKNFGTFGEQLAAYATGLSNYADIINGIDAQAVTDSIAVTNALVDVADRLEANGVFDGIFFGKKQDLEKFGDNIEELGKSLKKYYGKISEIDLDDTQKSVDIVKQISDMSASLLGLDTSGLINLSTALTTVASSGIASFTDTFYDAEEEFKGVGKFVILGLKNGINDEWGNLDQFVERMTAGLVQKFRNLLKIQSPSRVMRDEVGVFIVEGIAEGIESDDSAEEAAKKKAQNIVNAFKTELDKLDLRQKIADKELELWQADNPHADKEEAHLKELEHLRGKLQNQAEKARLAAAEWKAMSQEFGEESDAAQEAYEKFLEEQITLRKYTSELLEFRASEIDPSVSRDELGRYIMHGIASGITADTTAEDAAAQKAKNIVAAFKTELDRFDASLETADLEYKVWAAANSNASDTEKVLKEYEILDTKLTLAAQKTKTAEAEWRATTMAFGEDSEDAQSARNKYLTEQASFMEIVGSMTELEGDALFGRAMQLKARMEEAGETLDGSIEDFFSRNLDSDTMRTAMKYLDMAGPVEVIFDDAEEPVDEGIEEILDGVTKDLNVKLEEDIPKAVAAATKAAVPAITQSGADAADAYADGFGEGLPSKLLELLAMLDSGTLTFAKVQKAFDMGQIGQDMYQGLIDGLKSQGKYVLETVQDGAQSILGVMCDEMDEHSPSREFYKIGEYCVIGFANAFLDLLGLATGSTERFGETAITSMFDTMAQVEALLDSGVDFRPVISPVLDLGYIRDGVQQMDAMLDTSPSYRMAASTDRYREAARSQNATTDALNRLDKNLSNYMAESVNAMQEVLDEYAEGLTVQITMKTPDGRVLAEELVQPLISVSRSKGTPFYTPKQ